MLGAHTAANKIVTHGFRPAHREAAIGFGVTVSINLLQVALNYGRGCRLRRLRYIGDLIDRSGIRFTAEMHAGGDAKIPGVAIVEIDIRPHKPGPSAEVITQACAEGELH